MADLENEKRFLNELRDENGVKVGPKILEFFLENENATVIGVPGSGKTTILQVLKKIAESRKTNPQDQVMGIAFDMAMDVEANKLRKHPSEWSSVEADQFSSDLTALLLKHTASNFVVYDMATKSGDRVSLVQNQKTIADLIGVGRLNLGNTTATELARQRPNMEFVHAIPHPQVLDIAAAVREAFYPLGTSDGSRERLNKISQEFRRSFDYVRARLTYQGQAILEKYNIKTDIDDPVLMAQLIAKMGSPLIIQYFRADINNQANRLAEDRKITLPDKSMMSEDPVGYEIAVHVAHSCYYLPNVLNLPPERTFRVINYPQFSDGPVPWNLGGLYEFKA